MALRCTKVLDLSTSRHHILPIISTRLLLCRGSHDKYLEECLIRQGTKDDSGHYHYRCLVCHPTSQNVKKPRRHINSKYHQDRIRYLHIPLHVSMINRTNCHDIACICCDRNFKDHAVLQFSCEGGYCFKCHAHFEGTAEFHLSQHVGLSSKSIPTPTHNHEEGLAHVKTPREAVCNTVTACLFMDLLSRNLHYLAFFNGN